jgi:hypothetical protein
MEARMSSADLVHRKGLGSALWRSMKAAMSAWRSATLRVVGDYFLALEDAVTRVRINVSLAIRNAFDRVRNDRAGSVAEAFLPNG